MKKTNEYKAPKIDKIYKNNFFDPGSPPAPKKEVKKVSPTRLNSRREMEKMKKWAMREAIKTLKQKERELNDRIEPGVPLNQPVAASLTLKPIEVTAPTPAPGTTYVIQAKTAMDLALDRLRAQIKDNL